MTRVASFPDRRNPEQMRHSDSIEAKRFAWRVARNVKELRRLAPAVTTQIHVTRADIELARLEPVRADAWRLRLRRYRERFQVPDFLRLQAG